MNRNTAKTIPFEFKPGRLKPRRLQQKLSLEKLADLASTTAGNLSRIETGRKKNINTDTLGKIAAVLKVTPNYFFGKD